MEVILLEKIANLGELGDLVRVKNGYARNFLLPQGRALPATEKHRAELEHRLDELRAAAEERLEKARERSEQIVEEVVISANASNEGVLYGSIGARDIAEAITEAGDISVHRREVNLPDGQLRAVGSYEVELLLHSDLKRSIKVTVIPA